MENIESFQGDLGEIINLLHCIRNKSPRFLVRDKLLYEQLVIDDFYRIIHPQLTIIMWKSQTGNYMNITNLMRETLSAGILEEMSLSPETQQIAATRGISTIPIFLHFSSYDRGFVFADGHFIHEDLIESSLPHAQISAENSAIVMEMVRSFRFQSFCL